MAMTEAVSVTGLREDVLDDLVTTNEIGDGTRDYQIVDGVLVLNCYDDDRFDEHGQPIPSSTWRISISVEPA